MLYADVSDGSLLHEDPLRLPFPQTKGGGRTTKALNVCLCICTGVGVAMDAAEHRGAVVGG